MIENILIELALVIGVGFVVSGIFALLKQPSIIGYIATGIVLGPNVLDLTKSNNIMEVFSQLGIVILLFLVGLNLSPKILKEVGKITIIGGIGQMLFTTLFGGAIAYLIGYDLVPSLFIGIALAFSSTIVVMKILSDRGEIESLHGRITVGYLLMQDLFAMLIIAFISSSASGSGHSLSIQNVLIIFAALAALVPVSIFIFPRLMKKIAKSQEYLLLFSLGWCLLVSVFFYKMKFSMEIGALVAGVSLSISPFRHEIVSKLKPLRDLFIFIFFVSLGSEMVFVDLQHNIVPILIFSAFTIIFTPLIILFIMGRMGYSKKTAFLSGLAISQVSEFSLIFLSIGAKNNFISGDVLANITFVSLITMAVSTYLMLNSDAIFEKIAKPLSIFERKKKMNFDQKGCRFDYDVVVFGYDKLGYSLLKSLKREGKKTLIVDFNPEVIDHLESIGHDCMYGDADDSTFLDELCLHNVKMVISTIPIYETNSLILKTVRKHNEKTLVILVSNGIGDSFKLYDQGASYVIIPRFLGGEYAARLIEKNGFNKHLFSKARNYHLDYLGDRKMIKHFNK